MLFRIGLVTALLSHFAFANPWVDPELLQAIKKDKISRAMSGSSHQAIFLHRVLMHMPESMDLDKWEGLDIPQEEKAKLVSQELKKQIAKKMEQVKSQLGESKLIRMEPLWMTQSIVAMAPSDTVESLIQLNQIESLVLDSNIPVLEKEEFSNEYSQSSIWDKIFGSKIGWGIEKLQVNKLWDKGINGKGVTIAVIDSGANLTHSDLKDNLWVNTGETGLDKAGKDKRTNGIDDDGNGFIDDYSGWNFIKSNNKPNDENGHGSQTAGIVGGSGKGGMKTGVAPGAKLMILRTCCETGSTVFETDTIRAMQYAVEKGAKVISMSLSLKPNKNPNYARWRKASEVVLAAGVVHVNSAGNAGSKVAPFNMGAPATNPPAWFHPLQPYTSKPTSMITVGATDNRDKVRAFSSTGPVTWEKVEEYKDFPYGENGEKKGLIKPDVCAPSDVPSLEKISNGYTKNFGGTSSATPHVAGVVALLLQVKPKLTVAQVTEALQMSAVEVGGKFTPQCGAGRVDAMAAVEYVKKKF